MTDDIEAEIDKDEKVRDAEIILGRAFARGYDRASSKTLSEAREEVHKARAAARTRILAERATAKAEENPVQAFISAAMTAEAVRQGPVDKAFWAMRAHALAHLDKMEADLAKPCAGNCVAGAKRLDEANLSAQSYTQAAAKTIDKLTTDLAMEQNRSELLREDIECVHRRLKDLGAPIEDRGGKLSIVGRINRVVSALTAERDEAKELLDKRTGDKNEEIALLKHKLKEAEEACWELHVRMGPDTAGAFAAGRLGKRVAEERAKESPREHASHIIGASAVGETEAKPWNEKSANDIFPPTEDPIAELRKLREALTGWIEEDGIRPGDAWPATQVLYDLAIEAEKKLKGEG